MYDYTLPKTRPVTSKGQFHKSWELSTFRWYSNLAFNVIYTGNKKLFNDFNSMLLSSLVILIKWYLLFLECKFILWWNKSKSKSATYNCWIWLSVLKEQQNPISVLLHSTFIKLLKNNLKVIHKPNHWYNCRHQMDKWHHYNFIPGSNPAWDLNAFFGSKSLDCVMELWYYPGFQRNGSWDLMSTSRQSAMD